MLKDLDPTVTYTKDESDVTKEYPHGVRLQQKASFYEMYKEVRLQCALCGGLLPPDARCSSTAVALPAHHSPMPYDHRPNANQSTVFWSNSAFYFKDTPWANTPYTGTKEQEVRAARGAGGTGVHRESRPARQQLWHSCCGSPLLTAHRTAPCP